MIFFFSLFILGIVIIICILRAIKGPTPFDRILSISSIGTVISLCIILHGFAYGRPDFIDISLMYILLNFLGTLSILKFYKFKKEAR